VTLGGVAVPIDVKADDMDRRVLVVTPKDGMWKVGTGYSVAVASTAADLFGVKLPAPLSLGFSVVEGGVSGQDGGPLDDGGAPDGGAAPDAPADAPDAATDAGTSG
jgi:hypothetical protein